MASVLGQRLATEAAEAGANVARFFAPCPQLNPPSTNVAQLPLGANEAVAWRNQQGGDPQKYHKKTRSVREVLDETLGSTTNQDQEFKWLQKTKYSKAMTLAVDAVLKKFEHRKSSKIEDPLPITSNVWRGWKCTVPISRLELAFLLSPLTHQTTVRPQVHSVTSSPASPLSVSIGSSQAQKLRYVASIACKLGSQRTTAF
jgi:hypothetical protein